MGIRMVIVLVLALLTAPLCAQSVQTFPERRITLYVGFYLLADTKYRTEQINGIILTF